MRLVMSISLKVVNIAKVFCAPLRRSATRALNLVIFTRLHTCHTPSHTPVKMEWSVRCCNLQLSFGEQLQCSGPCRVDCKALLSHAKANGFYETTAAARRNACCPRYTAHNVQSSSHIASTTVLDWQTSGMPATHAAYTFQVVPGCQWELLQRDHRCPPVCIQQASGVSAN